MTAVMFTDRCRLISVLGRPGGICGEAEPDPIPNSAVKLACANGTKSPGLEQEVAGTPAKDRTNSSMLSSTERRRGNHRRRVFARRRYSMATCAGYAMHSAHK